ncbi:methyl-CpG-binding domain-containing protein 7 [Humulus lupulus]|uniref:methyl-CpG-binding domain-containing protein 7 n=1 Tax=Humulus lupulus TaxID=3486 RepID=UPI002B415023|nr:methyl-CpG-binding domain-containing protein 7 [Humulus lupulus]
MKRKARAIKVKPLQTLPACTDAHSDHRLISTSTSVSTQFTLPHDWLVQHKPRPSRPSQIDKYYIEPGTGNVFRSLVAVERYLRDGETHASPDKVLKESGNKCTQIILLNTKSSSKFTLPDDWIIGINERKKGATAGRIDKYYVEPGTGRQFRSLRDVERHLKETNMVTAPVKIQHSLLITERPPNFVLPDGWIIQKTPRRKSIYSDRPCKHYVELKTGNVFRSLKAVERHLKEEEAKEYAMTLNAFKHSHKRKVSTKSDSHNVCAPDETRSTKVNDDPPTTYNEHTIVSKEVTHHNVSGLFDHSDSPKKSNPREEVEASMDDFSCTPSKIKWVLGGPAGDMWNPFVGDFMVPESMKQKWSETFISSLHGEKLKPGVCGMNDFLAK